MFAFIVIWQGLGLFAVVIPVFVWIGLQVLVRVVLGVDDVKLNPVIGGLTLLASSAVVYVIAERLAARPDRVTIDKATGQAITLRQKHTFFFVPMRYWAVLFAVVGPVLFTAGVVKALI